MMNFATIKKSWWLIWFFFIRCVYECPNMSACKMSMTSKNNGRFELRNASFQERLTLTAWDRSNRGHESVYWKQVHTHKINIFYYVQKLKSVRLKKNVNIRSIKLQYKQAYRMTHTHTLKINIFSYIIFLK